MEASVIIMFIILVAFFIVTVVISTVKKSFVSKGNVFYFIPLLIINFILYAMGLSYKGSFDSTSVFECLSTAIKSFTFDVKRDYIAQLASDNTLYGISVYFSTVLSGWTLISSLLGFVKFSIINAFRLIFKLSKKSVDLVIGHSKEAIKFAKDNKNSIIVLRRKDLTKELRQELFEKNIAYVVCPLKSKDMSTLFKFIYGEITLFIFDIDSKGLSRISSMIEEVKLPNNKKIAIHVNTAYDEILFVNKLLTKAISSSSNTSFSMASSFNIYQNIANKFNEDHNLAKYLPEGFIKDGVIQKDKKIRLVILGYGKTTNAILESIVLNNQFVEEKNKKYCLKPYVCDIYDSSTQAFDNKMIKLFFEKEGEYYKDNFETPVIINYHKENLKNNVKMDNVLSLKDDPNEYTFFIINVGNTLDNLLIVNSLLEKGDKNVTIFYNVDSKKEIINLYEDNVYPIGFKNELLKRDIIVDEKCVEEAKTINKLYNDLSGKGENFTTLNIVEKLSNIYANRNTEFKLNILGLSLKDTGKEITKDEYKEIYLGKAKFNEYDDYFKLNTVNALRYQEHARWEVYYYLNGFKKMNYEDIYFDESSKKIIHKNLKVKTHACLVNFYDLDKLIKFEVDLKIKKYKELYNEDLDYKQTLNNLETLKYDSQILDGFLTNDVKVYKK